MQSSHPAPSNADRVRAALTVAAVLLGMLVLWQARAVVLTLFLGLLFGVAAVPAVDWLERRRIRRGVGAALVVFGGAALVVAILLAAAPTLVRQSVELRTALPQAVADLERWLTATNPAIVDVLAPPDAAIPAGERFTHALARQAESLKAILVGILSSSAAAAGGVVIIVFFATYVAAEPDVYRGGVLRVVPPAHRARVAETMDVIGQTLRTWLVAQMVAMLAIGLISTVVFLLLGVRAALPLGIIAGLLEFIPNIGPTLAAVPAAALGFVDSSQKGMLVIAACWGIQFVENNLLIPWLMREHLDLPPALTMAVQVAMALLFGFLGLFVAVPLLASVLVVLRRHWLEPRDAAASPALPAPSAAP